MGTNSKSSHASYAVSPTVTTDSPSAPVALGTEPPPEPATLTEWETELLQSTAPATEPPAEAAIPEEDGGASASAGDSAGSAGEDTTEVAAEPAHSGEVGAEPPSEGLEESAADQQAVEGDQPANEDGVDASGLSAEEVQVEEPDEEETDPPLTPVPDEPPVGVATGTPVLVGGEDFINSQATLVAYASADGPREVLLAHVSEEAESKLLEALSVSGTKMVDVEVEEEVKERLALDKEKQLGELVTKATTSVQHKLKDNLPMSEASIQKHQQALDAVNSVLSSADLSDAEKEMAQYYLDQLNVVGEKINNGGETMPHFEQFGHMVTKTVTKQIPAPADEPEPGTLAAQLRDASRIKAQLDPQTGESSWDGTSRSKANGKEYSVDLGDGWSAVYRPYAANDPSKTEFSMRGQLEVHAPVGGGHGKELVDRLEQLHLVNAPMTASEGEWTYLTNNVAAQGLDKGAAVKAAFAEAKGLEDLQVQELVHQQASSLIGLDEDALHYQVKRIQLEAAKTVLPKKVAVLREAVAKATGFDSGDALAASSGYDPTPATSGGWLTWSRFDVAGNAAEVSKAFSGKSLTHNIGGGEMTKLFATGVLASTEKRSVMGIGGGVGMSEAADKYSGGANSVFLRVKNTPSSPGGGRLIWDDPSVLMRRSDYYAYDGDHYGAINPAGGKSMHGMTRDPMKIASFSQSNNEIMFRDGIDLLGAEAPSRIMCEYAHERTEMLEFFKKRGITHLRGKAVEDVVQTAH
ncbi:hypothetical protein [Streptomyces canus]|uniref:Uncharacterized protein n=1 Tax=Streptomyces canus TaxID=58343 RepID=A0A101RL27_9ACTN|nr:hypothetical protein [Streptomyces canus]KUN57590.1 hypothetical protein AQJ46_46860 [Streptomyces canus]